VVTEDRWTKRYRWHMESIPELLRLTRGDVAGIRATRYDGDRVTGGGDPRKLPFAVDAVDAGDELWSLLVIYALEVVDLVGGWAPPVLRSGVWNTREAQGLPPGVSGDAAYTMAAEVTDWLVGRSFTVSCFEQLAETEDHLFRRVRDMRARYGLDDRARCRLCDVCGERGVTAMYSDVAGVEHSKVWCLVCGHIVEEVRRVDESDVSAGRETRSTVGEHDQAVAASRARDGVR
jgi:hypothetical protein